MLDEACGLASEESARADKLVDVSEALRQRRHVGCGNRNPAHGECWSNRTRLATNAASLHQFEDSGSDALVGR